MLFHPIRDLITALLAGCLSFAARAQLSAGGSGESGGSVIVAGTGGSVTFGADRPQPFAPGIVASRFDEWGTSFTPDNNTVYFSRGGYYWTVCYAQYKDGAWQRPHVASFSGKWKDTDPFVSPDGKKLFFVSNRPVEGKEDGNPFYHLWYVEVQPGGVWGAPHHIGDAVNVDSGNNYGPSVSAKGTLYWCSRNRQGNQGMQGYYAAWLGDHYAEPKMVQVPTGGGRRGNSGRR